MGKPTGFMEIPRETPTRRPVPERLHDFFEVYNPFSEEKLVCRLPAVCPRMHRLAFPGGVAEWLMATVCKTVRRKSYAGSNPAPTTLNQVCAAHNRGSLCQAS